MNDVQAVRLTQGLELLPTAEGIVIRTVDYHPSVVLLTWELIDGLRAQGAVDPEQPRESES